MHIVIDGREANAIQRVGSNVYAFHIIWALHDLLTNKEDVTVTVVLSENPQLDLPSPTERWRYKVFGPARFWTQWALPIHLYIHKHEYDVFFTPSHYAPRLCPIPYASSVMDVAFLHFPAFFKKNDLLQLKLWTEYSVRNAQKVITISKHARKAIISAYAKSPDDVVVAYPSVSKTTLKPSLTFIKKTHKKFGIQKPFILYIGTIQPRKNLIALIEALEVLHRITAGRSLQKKRATATETLEKPIQLVLAGKIGWLSEPILERIAQSPLKEHIITTGFITQEEKAVLLGSSSALVLVGLYEGFGIPALEALMYKTIPVVARTSSLPEVVGKAGIIVDPENPHKIAEGIWKALNQTAQERTRFYTEARTQLGRFSWEQSAIQIWNTLCEIVRR